MSKQDAQAAGDGPFGRRRLMSPIRDDLRGERVGLFTLDPGRTTGLTVSTITLEGSTKEIFERDPMFGDEVDCWDQSVPEFLCEVEGAKVVAETYQEAQFHWLTEESIPLSRHFFVSEDFVLNRQPGTWERHGLAPVRVLHLVMGMLIRQQINWVVQTSSEAMQINNGRLRSLGLWERGISSEPHRLDATRHAVQWVRRAMR
jgi:hypothetical protein